MLFLKMLWSHEFHAMATIQRNTMDKTGILEGNNVSHRGDRTVLRADEITRSTKNTQTKVFTFQPRMQATSPRSRAERSPAWCTPCAQM